MCYASEMDKDSLLQQLKTELGPERPDGFTLRDEANAIVAKAVRNGPIEDLHAGRTSELLKDPDLSRITDDEMKTLMIAACRSMYELLVLKETDLAAYWVEIVFASAWYCRQWER